MALKISYKCSKCGIMVEWTYDMSNGEIFPERMVGCPGESCKQIHYLDVNEINGNIRDESN